jgi:DNA-binding transcriptional ArsR family regulator
MELLGYANSGADRLDATFAALADPTRRAILARLASGEASVNELAEPFEMSQPAISKHLKVLERAGLISRGLDAQRRPRRLEAQPLGEANEWLERYRQFWEASFKRLDALLLELKDGQTRTRESMIKESKAPHAKSHHPKNQHLKTQESKTQGKKHGRTKRHGK